MIVALQPTPELTWDVSKEELELLRAKYNATTECLAASHPADRFKIIDAFSSVSYVERALLWCLLVLFCLFLFNEFVIFLPAGWL